MEKLDVPVARCSPPRGAASSLRARPACACSASPGRAAGLVAAPSPPHAPRAGHGADPAAPSPPQAENIHAHIRNAKK